MIPRHSRSILCSAQCHKWVNNLIVFWPKWHFPNWNPGNSTIPCLAQAPPGKPMGYGSAKATLSRRNGGSKEQRWTQHDHRPAQQKEAKGLSLNTALGPSQGSSGWLGLVGACSDSCTDLPACPSATIFHYLSAWRTCILFLVSLWRLKVFLCVIGRKNWVPEAQPLQTGFFLFFVYVRWRKHAGLWAPLPRCQLSRGKASLTFWSDSCGIMLQDSLIWANLLGFCSLYLYSLLWENLKLLLSLKHMLQILTKPTAFSMCGPGFRHAVKDTAKAVAERWWRQHEKPDQTCSIQLQKQAFVACSQYGSGVKVPIWAFSNRWPFSDRHCGVG